MAHHQLSWLQTFISRYITTSMDSVGWMCFCISSAQLHTWGSWWQDDVRHLKSPVRTYIHDTVIRWYRCLCVPTVLLYSELERPGLQELWLICNSGITRVILPLHDIFSALGNDLIKCLPVVRALTGCDTTSKIATKSAALNVVQKPESSSLVLTFNSPQLTESSIQMAETFLIKCLKPTTDLETFDDLRLAVFNRNALKLDFERTACISTNARKHIHRAYYQVQLWVQAPFRDATLTMDAEAYGFERKENNYIDTQDCDL